MQLTLLSVATALAATASAGKSAVQLNAECNLSQPHAKIINRCDYDVHIWSVWKNIGCADSQMVTLKKGETYAENYQHPEGGDQGVSIKVSKTDQCTGSNIVQLEYFLETREKGFDFNYLDVSYVDCLGGDCPTKKEGYYLSAGTPAERAMKATDNNSWCPILSCSNAAECAKMSYILPDDVQTKTCGLDASMEFYMCGGEPPSADDDTPAPSSSSSQKADTPSPQPTPSAKTSSSAAAEYKVAAAAVTPAAEVQDAVKEIKIKTNIVYVTKYEYVNAKRSEHAHAHARRHQPFHA